MSKYSYLSDKELVRLFADYDHPVVKELVSRLDRREEPYSVFYEQTAFMQAMGQTTKGHNSGQAEMYWALIEEEMEEMRNAMSEVDEFDAVLDLIVVLIGYGISRGYPMKAGWDEVLRSNFAKVDPVTGKIKRREDGKILKPDGWTPPNLAALMS